jgi:hypothetical protein
MKIILGYISLLFGSTMGYGQTIHSIITTPYVQMGAYSKNFSDAFSFTDNPASIVSLKQAAVGVVGERRGMMEETSYYSIVFGLPLAGAGLGLQLNYFGFEDYNESQIGIAYGKSLGKFLDLGAQFNYYSVHMSGYGNAFAINFELGAMLHLSDDFQFGFHVYNPIGGKLGKQGLEKLASVYSVGAGYEVSKQVFVSAEIIKEENKEVEVNMGLQYVFAKQFFARAGILATVGNPYAGVGLLWDRFRLDMAVGYHPQLGFTPGLLLMYHFKKE